MGKRKTHLQTVGRVVQHFRLHNRLPDDLVAMIEQYFENEEYTMSQRTRKTINQWDKFVETENNHSGMVTHYKQDCLAVPKDRTSA